MSGVRAELWTRFACAALAGCQSDERSVREDVELAAAIADKMLEAYAARFSVSVAGETKGKDPREHGGEP